MFVLRRALLDHVCDWERGYSASNRVLAEAARWVDSESSVVFVWVVAVPLAFWCAEFEDAKSDIVHRESAPRLE